MSATLELALKCELPIENLVNQNESLDYALSNSQDKLASAEIRAKTAEAKVKKLGISLTEAKADVEQLRKINAEAENREDQIQEFATAAIPAAAGKDRNKKKKNKSRGGKNQG